MSRVLVKNAAVWEWDDESCENYRDSSCRRTGRVSPKSHLIIENGFVRSLSTDCAPRNEEFDTVVDVAGGLVLPGLIDSHIHVEMVGESQFFIDLRKCDSIESLKTTIAEKLPDLHAVPCIVGFNWDQNLLGRTPNLHDLDSLPTNKPMFLWRACWHIGVANSCALGLAGLEDAGEAIQGGEVEVDADGRPTGLLKETAVAPVIAAFAQHKSIEQRRMFIKLGMDLCRRAGLTTLQTNDENSVDLYCQLETHAQLPLRILLTPQAAELDRALDQRPKHAMRLQSPVSRLAVERVKIFSDGSLGAETAAIRDPIAPQHMRGILVHPTDALVQQIVAAESHAMRLEIHAIGDAAAEQVLAALAQAQLQLERAPHRPILTHCQVLGEDLLPQMKALDVVANVQPSFVPTDMAVVTKPGRLSESQHRYAYAWKTLLHAGIVVAGGSDAPIETASPFTGMFDAIFRSNAHRVGAIDGGTPSSAPMAVYRSEECLSFAEALWLYTRGGAWAAGYEGQLGALLPGYYADLVVVDGRCVQEPQRLHDLHPALVMVGGQVVHMNPQPDVLVVLEKSDDRSVFRGEGGGEEGQILACEPTRLEGAAGLPGKSGQPPRATRRGYCKCCILGPYCFP